jgi:hypothetical protein
MKVLTSQGSYDIDLTPEQFEVMRKGPVKGQPLRSKAYRGILELGNVLEKDAWCTVDATGRSIEGLCEGRSDVVSFPVGRRGLYVDIVNRERRLCIDVGETVNDVTGATEHLVVAGRPETYSIAERPTVQLRPYLIKQGNFRMRTNIIQAYSEVQPEYKHAFEDLIFRWSALEVKVPSTHLPAEKYWQISGVEESWYRQGTESMYALHAVAKELSHIHRHLTGNPVPILFSRDTDKPDEFFSYNPNDVPDLRLRIAAGVNATIWVKPKDDLAKLMTVLLPEVLHRRFPDDAIAYEGLSDIGARIDTDKIDATVLKSAARRFKRARR